MSAVSRKHMYGMFYSCSSLTSLNLSSFDTSKATHGGRFFSGCSKPTVLKLGAKFSWKGAKTSRVIAAPPAPSASKISGADGKWYISSGVGFAPADIPSNVADTYYASASLVP